MNEKRYDYPIRFESIDLMSGWLYDKITMIETNDDGSAWEGYANFEDNEGCPFDAIFDGKETTLNAVIKPESISVARCSKTGSEHKIKWIDFDAKTVLCNSKSFTFDECEIISKLI